MKHTINTFVLSIALLVTGLIAVLAPSTASAVTCKTEAGVEIGDTAKEGDCAEKTAFKFGECKDTGVSISCLVASTMRFMSILVGILVVAGITVGGIVYSTGGGNPGQTKKGVTIITNSVSGLVLYLLMFALVNFLIPGGILS